MSQDANAVISPALAERVKGMILKPAAEWERIDAEPYNLGALLTGYVMILAAIGPVCHAIGAALFGLGGFGFSYHPPLLSILVEAVVSYALSIAGVFVLAFIIDALAPNFGGTKNNSQAMKVATYSATASWLVGVFGLLPALMPLAILGLYSLYLLYLGLPRLMKAPAEKALAYTAVVVVCAIVLGMVIGILLIPLRGFGLFGASPFGHGGAISAPGLAGGTVQINGTNVDLGKMQAAAGQLQAQAQAMKAAEAGAPAPAGAPTGLAPDQLKALLPASVDGLDRQETSSASAGTAGVGATQAEAQYAKGDARLTLNVTDMSTMGGLGSMAAAMNVNSSKETATGYERVSTVNGRMTTEEFDNASKHGKYGVLVAGRVMVEAQGDNVTMDMLKAAVNAVGPDRVDAMAHH